MNKTELIERMQEYLEKLQDVQSEGFCIAEDIDNKGDFWEEIDTKLRDIDAEIDDQINHLEELIQEVENYDKWEYTTSYAKATAHINNMILFNKIGEIDEKFWEGPEQNSEECEAGEPMQYYLTDCNDSDVEYLCENYDRMRFIYSDLLELWVLIVDHWGTSWDLVEIGTHNEYDKI